MGYIKKLKNNELVGGTDKTTIYPVTSTKAVFEEVTDGDKSSFKSQKTINKEQQDELDDHEERIQAAEVEDIKSITINGSTKEFRVDDNNNVDLTIYTVDNDPEMPSIASNVEDLRNMVGTSTPVQETSHKTRIETLEGGESVAGSVENKIKTKVDSINSSYQDDDNEYVKYSMTQTSGKVTNFNIDETSLKNAITSLNTSISGDNIVIRSGSTPSGTGEAGKIYRYVNSGNNTYTDYMYSGGSWVTLAIHDTSDEQSQVAYYTCTATGSGAQTTKQFVSNGSLEYTPSSGGHIKILMGEANTATGTIYLQFGTTTNTKKPLYYNGEPASASNTWETGETIAVYYDPSANNNAGAYFASNAQGGGGKAEKIKYDNSQSGLAATDVQGALDEFGQEIFSYVKIDFVNQTERLNYYIKGNNGEWAEYSSSYKYTCRILPIGTNTRYRITSSDGNPCNIALLTSNIPDVGEVATDWNEGIPLSISAGESIVIDSGEYTYLYLRNNVGSDSTDFKFPEKVEKSSSAFERIEDEINDLSYSCLSVIDFLAETSLLAYWIGSSGKWNAKSDTYPYYCRILPVEKNRKYKITANNTRNAQYALLSSDTPNVGTQATEWNNGIPKTITTNESADVDTGSYEYLYIRYDETYYDYPKSVEEYVTVQEALDSTEQPCRKELDIEYGFITASGDSAGYNSPKTGTNYDYKYWRNSGMIKVNLSAEYTIDTNVEAVYVRFYWYDKNRTYIGTTLVTPLSLGEDGLYHASAVADGCFLRIVLLHEDEYAPKAYINGVLEDDCKTFLSGTPPTGSVNNFLVATYYQTLNSDIEETSEIQDVGYTLINRGLIKLPTNYDPDGEPSRLVIYCHGADGFQNWNDNTNSFDVDHIDPTLWVNSGYAVMDMDDLTRASYLQDQDIPTLLTQNCYKEGYEYVLRNYNIMRDGIILCGRSLGGQRVMMLLGSQLPILCCCLIAPSCCFSRYWNMRDRRRITTVYNNFPTTIDIDGVETDINWGNTNAISDVEWAAMQKYYRLLLNTHGILKLLCVTKSDFFATHTINGDEVSLRSNPELWDRYVFTNWAGKTNVPIKVWYAEDDNILPDPTRQHELLLAIVSNGGGVCEYHKIATGGHYPERDGATVTYTNKYGVTYENTSLIYAEMLQFIRRYEQK